MKLWASLLCFAAAIAAADRPNIVFLLTDDQRWDAMSMAGHPFIKTPNMDRIGREGAHFRNAFVTTPLCSPSRASFLTGSYVHSHQVTDNTDHNELSHKLTTFPLLLQRAGYDTAYMGKWHMGTDDKPRPGFNRWVSFRGQGAYYDPAMNIDGKQETVKGYMTDILTGHAVEFIKAKRDKPFVLYVAHKAIHGPFQPAERHKGVFASQPITRAPNAKDTLEGKPMLQRKVGELPPVGPGTGSSDELIRNQLATLMAVDEGVGRVLKALEETGQLDNTLVVFTSDNGYFWGEHGLGDKRLAYEESLRIPMVMRYPKLIKAGTVIDRMVLNIDMAPTFLDAAGVKPDAAMQGRSVLPLLAKRNARWRSAFFSEYFMEKNTPRIPSWQAVRTDGWKYIHYTELEGMNELYDLKADRYDMKNLIADPAAKRPLERMKSELAKQRKETGL